MPRVNLKIHLKDNSVSLARHLRARTLRTLGDLAEETRDQARATVPVDTGNLRGTIEAHQEDEQTWIASMGGSTEESPEGADYALHVEGGTSRMAARPSFIPAVEQAIHEAPGRLVADAREAVREVTRGR